MTLGVLALLLAAVCACVLSSRVAPAHRVDPDGRARTALLLPMVLCSWWPEVLTRPG